MEKDRVHNLHNEVILRGWVTTQPPIKWRQQEKKVEKDRTNSKDKVEEKKRLETMCKSTGFLKIWLKIAR